MIKRSWVRIPRPPVAILLLYLLYFLLVSINEYLGETGSKDDERVKKIGYHVS